MSRKQFLPSRSWLSLQQASCTFYFDADGLIGRHDPSNRGHLLMRRLTERALADVNRDLGDFAEAVEWARQRWSESYLPAFNDVVSNGKVTLYYKAAENSHFQQLPPDVWSHLRVVDWNDGSAVDVVTNKTFFMIHASITWGVKLGRKSKINLDQAKAFVFPLLGKMDIGSKAKRGQQAAIEKALIEYLGDSVSESTVRECVKSLLAAYRKQKAGN